MKRDGERETERRMSRCQGGAASTADEEGKRKETSFGEASGLINERAICRGKHKQERDREM